MYDINELYNMQCKILYNYVYNPDGLNTITINNVKLQGIEANGLYKVINQEFNALINKKRKELENQNECAKEIKKLLGKYNCHISGEYIIDNETSIGVKIES